MNSVDQEIGYIRENSMLLAVLQRTITNLIPHTYHGEIREIRVFTFKRNFKPPALKLSLDFSSDTLNVLDRRLGVAASVLLCAIEGRQR